MTIPARVTTRTISLIDIIIGSSTYKNAVAGNSPGYQWQNFLVQFFVYISKQRAIETSKQIQFQKNLKVLGQSAFRRDLQLGWQETLKLN